MTDLGGQYGVWRRGVDADPQFAAAVEELGYRSLWLGAVTVDDLDRSHELLAATTGLIVATGIVNIWTIRPDVAAAWFHRSHAAYPGRAVLGIGTGHREAQGDQAATPYQALVAYVGALRSAGVPADRIVIAALGPRALKLSRDEAGGTHPYLTTPEHTRAAREIVGPDRLVVTEQHVKLGDDPAENRRAGREALTFYLKLTNYRNSWLRQGFTEADLAGGGSDALVDGLVAQGSAAAVAERLRAHLKAGADQVVIQALGEDPIGDLTALADELG
ncbi:TIGR03620 family F420-dependent LLM class oxidoreductase [Actinoplanes rectilineatus]|uniref:TIGR03620 family F420-dependent LLM class oxidoreductase n=1 Tax=Actinoplanes rectilineatus TaxID=113571 RepID=UPI0005F2F4B3|nr:TIGR03620 family F420-dependent LLM class oxidoreductase [Actinoplanes rectilineatus]